MNKNILSTKTFIIALVAMIGCTHLANVGSKTNDNGRGLRADAAREYLYIFWYSYGELTPEHGPMIITKEEYDGINFDYGSFKSKRGYKDRFPILDAMDDSQFKEYFQEHGFFVEQPEAYSPDDLSQETIISPAADHFRVQHPKSSSAEEKLMKWFCGESEPQFDRSKSRSRFYFGTGTSAHVDTNISGVTDPAAIRAWRQHPLHPGKMLIVQSKKNKQWYASKNGLRVWFVSSGFKQTKHQSEYQQTKHFAIWRESQQQPDGHTATAIVDEFIEI